MSILLKPEPFNEACCEDPFWKDRYKDRFDQFLPSRPGFLSDMVYYLRGTEVPTAYTSWVSLFLISALLKRDAWVDWFPSRFFGNLYVILVGMAAAKKTTMIDIGLRILSDVPGYIGDPVIRQLKATKILKNKATPEAILEAMRPKGGFVMEDEKGNPIVDSEGVAIIKKGSSEMSIVLPEMAVMINKQSYTESMIQNLMDLYDCHGTWEWHTKGSGKTVLRNLYTTLLAGTTPEGFQNSVPRAAAGDGFLSRTVVVYQEDTDREFWRPLKVGGAPEEAELSKRLAYIATVMQGEYKLSKEADEYGEEWYHRYKTMLKARKYDRGFLGRMATNLLKIALLMKAQGYPDFGDKVISLENLQDSERIVRATYMQSRELVVELKEGDTFQLIARVREYIKERKRVSRKQVISNCRVPAAKTDDVIYHLSQEGSVRIMGKNDVEKTFPTSDGNESYVYNLEYERYEGEEEETNAVFNRRSPVSGESNQGIPDLKKRKKGSGRNGNNSYEGTPDTEEAPAGVGEPGDRLILHEN